MKRTLFFIFTALGFFVLLSVVVLPEYRVRTLLLSAVYLVVYYFVFKLLVLEHLRSLAQVFFRKRMIKITASFLLFLLLVVAAVSLSRMDIFKKARYRTGSNNTASLSSRQEDYLSRYIRDRYEIIYIRPSSGQDYTALFNSMMQEVSLYSKGVSYTVIHPAAQAEKYSQIRKELPSIKHGEVAVMGPEMSVVVDKVTPYGIINGLYRSSSGLSSVCVIQGQGEASIDDYSEQGAGIAAQMLRDRGLSLVRADFKYLNSCPVSLILDPSIELTVKEIESLRDYRGGLVIIGGSTLQSIRNFLASKGIEVAPLPIESASQGAFRDYMGGLVIDSFYEHPSTMYVNSPAVVSSAHEVNCKDCALLAAASNKKVMAAKDNIRFFSGSSLSNNFFMRFKGNAQLLSGMLSSSFAGGGTVIPPDEGRPDSPKMFAVSPRYLNMIFVLTVVILPLLFLMLGIYCFRSNRG